jgi:hypothetical protein
VNLFALAMREACVRHQISKAAGTITDVWVKADFSGAILVLECADKGEATAALRSLPIAINHAATFVLTEVIDLDSVQTSVS